MLFSEALMELIVGMTAETIDANVAFVAVAAESDAIICARREERDERLDLAVSSSFSSRLGFDDHPSQFITEL
jgi:hypothetical protein